MLAETDPDTPSDADPPSEPPAAKPDEDADPPRPAHAADPETFLDALMRALGPIHT